MSGLPVVGVGSEPRLLVRPPLVSVLWLEVVLLERLLPASSVMKDLFWEIIRLGYTYFGMDCRRT